MRFFPAKNPPHKKLDNSPKDFKFVDLLTADSQVDWEKAKIIDLSKFDNAPNPS
jgi:hypothetical protein